MPHDIAHACGLVRPLTRLRALDGLWRAPTGSESRGDGSNECDSPSS